MFKFSKSAKVILILFGIIAVLLVVTEIFARTIEPKVIFPTQCFQQDKVLNHSHTTGKICKFQTRLWDITYKINSLGLRDREYSIQKPDGVYRILIIGDSFTEGWGIEQDRTYSDQLEKLLIDRFPVRKIEVINAGVASYSPILEYLYLKERGLALEPDLVILAFDMTDFLDEKEYAKVTTLDENNQPIAVRPFTPGHIQTYVNNLKNPQIENKLAAYIAKYSALARLISQPKAKQLDVSGLFKPNHESWQLVQKHLQLISELLNDNKINFLLITYPYYDQLKNDFFLQPQKDLAQFAKEQNIDFVDLTQYFRDQEAESSYIKRDVHLSEKGHLLVADKLADYLIETVFSKD